MDRATVTKELSKYEGLTQEVVSHQFGEISGYLAYGDRILSEGARTTACEWAGVPKKFLEKCDLDLQATILNRFSMGEIVPRTIFKDEMILAFSDPKKHMMAPEKVLETVESKFPIEIFDRLYIHDGAVELYVVGPEEKPVVKGDVVKGGAYINFSPLAEFHPEVVSYVYRLACTNGALRTDQLMRYRYNEGNDPYNWLADTVATAYDVANTEVERYKIMHEQKLDGNVSAVLRHMIEGFRKDVQAYIMKVVMDKKPETVYDLMNIITDIASHQVENPRTVFNLMGAVGNFADHFEVCPNCHQVVEGIGE